MHRSEYPSIEYLRQSFRYEDGKLFWIKRPLGHFSSEVAMRKCNTRYVGKEAGSIHIRKNDRNGVDKPRCIIGLNFGQFERSLLVWAFHHGEWPELMVDHIDRDTTNDRIDNLRLVDPSQSNMNLGVRKDSPLGYPGIKLMEWGKYKAFIRVRGERIHLGMHDTFEQAKAARIEAEQKYFGEFKAKYKE